MNERRERVLNDFRAFCEEALEMPIHEKPHHEMISFISDLTQMAKLMLVPRGCWKTSICSTAFPLWMVLRAYYLDGNPSYRCMIDSETMGFSESVLDAIENYVRYGQAFNMIFGSLWAKENRKENRFNLKFRAGRSGGVREPNFLSSGLKARKTGKHFDLIMLDDLVTKENYGTVDQREQVYEHYQMMYGIIDTDASGQKTMIHVVGTRYHDDDMYGRIIKADKKAVAEGRPPVFSLMVRAAYDDDGTLFFPDKLTMEVLNDKKRDNMMGQLFWAQFMNDPNKETAPFKVDQLKWKPLNEFPNLYRRRLTVDAAIKDKEIEHGDYNAMVVGGWDKWAQPWIMDVDLRRDLTTPLFLDRMLDMAAMWDVESIYVEIQNEAVLADLVRMEMQRRRLFFPVYYVKTVKLQGKLARWKRLQPFADRGGIHIADEIPESTKVEIRDQFGRCPFAQYDDFMDALEMQLSNIPLGGEVASDEVSVSAEDLIENKKRYQDNLPTLENVFPHIKKLNQNLDDEVEVEDMAEADEDMRLAERGLSW